MATKSTDSGIGGINLADLAGETAPVEGAAPGMEPDEDDEQMKQLEAMDPQTIVDFLKKSEILPKDFTIPEKAASKDSGDSGKLGDIGLSDLGAAPMTAPTQTGNM